MSSELVIRAAGLGKQYRIGGRQEGYRTFRESLSDALTAPIRRVGRLLKGHRGGAADLTETIWALREISFDVQRGEVIGIIGANGAGKSTLLKVLSRITEPTEGWAEIHGRVGSLLEVGTGFHPELTGHENIYLNGAILGMGRTEIAHKFDQIVAFSEIEKFINTPVKHYSSGMYLRLAFAVAAHLDPEILLVDEVLAVGDAKFQKRCIGKMSEVANIGRTVFFVSHNLVAIQDLCERVIWLDDGKILMDGDPATVVSAYTKSSSSIQTKQIWNDVETAPGNEQVRLHRIAVKPEDPAAQGPITMKTSFVVEVEFWSLKESAALDATLHVYSEQGIMAFGTSSARVSREHQPLMRRGLIRAICHIPGDLLNSGLHRINLLVVEDGSRILYRHDDGVSFEILDAAENRGSWYGKFPGVVRPNLEWQIDRLAGLP